MQNYERLYSYIHEYHKLVYDIYSKHAIACLVTYYNINTEETVWDNTDLMGGGYEKYGDLSGIKRNKYLLLPVYFAEEMSNPFDGQDVGLIKENTTSIVMPHTYGITPLAGDIVKLDHSYLSPTNTHHPVFIVGGAEISVNADRRFWKLRVENIGEPLTTIDDGVENVYTFFEYDKKIHAIEDAEFMTRLLAKNSTLKQRLKGQFDKNSGFYFM